MSSCARRRLRHDRRGAAALEFALIAPVFFATMLGAFDIAHRLYLTTVLQGSVQKTARDASLETGTEAQRRAALDAAILASVNNLSKDAEVKITRRFYRTFTDASDAVAEPFPGTNDTNKNGVCDNNEVFVDLNRNGIRDLDGGDEGQGTAQDKTVYTVSINAPHLFPVWRLIGGSNRFNVSATTVLANQPYADQGSYTGSTEGHCK